MDQDKKATGNTESQKAFSAPSISLPKGGGAIRSIGEKFAANPVTGSGSMTLPLAVSPGRSGFGPQLSLSYDSANGNGSFGLGWNLALPSITRKTDKGLPKYHDAVESDDFILSGMEDLVPVPPHEVRTVNRISYRIERYQPRIEGLFARIERWTNQADAKDTFWRSISKENVTTWYGKTENCRIADPRDQTRVFRWLICESHDDKGNLIVYRYKEENSSGIDLLQVHEKNRNEQTRSVNRYLKSIRYGNSKPYHPNLSEDQPPTPLQEDWLFEVVFDYGEHDPDAPAPNDPGAWPCRQDPFSSYRSGFEIRTYRLCQRVLMFHHFPEEAGVGANCLVRSTDFTHSYQPLFSFLIAATQTGYKRQPDHTYLRQSLPPIEFEYSQATIQEEVLTVDSESVENLPFGVDGTQYRWVDLDGEGLTGILTEQGNGWFYKRNLSPITENRLAAFGPVEWVAEKPSLSEVGSGRQQFLDLAGDGQLDLVDFQGPTPGFYERTPDRSWEPFRPFASLPELDWGDPYLKFIDLTGDGHADILITRDDVFCWYPSLAEEGFGPQETARTVWDEEKGPRLVFADGTHSIYLADMSGDGLTDLVRICNGEVCYWPNLGYGVFGTKVTMDNAPWFDHSDLFDHRRLHLADIDGSGVTDLIYLGRDGARLSFNLSGNSWSEVRTLAHFPRIDHHAWVAVVDLLGNGTACLVESSPLPSDAQQPMRYIDLMGGHKPHLLTKVVNNLGAETRVHYTPSTKFYLADKAEGKPWITRLPFPVHVVERVETVDWISRNRLVTRYAYHHGYFDGIEREFRGFGMVEQWDTEAFAGDGDAPPEWNQPPVTTRTWFHTGTFFNREMIGEYYRKEKHLPEPVLPTGLDDQEFRECLRALKGLPLRQEIYSFDGSAQEQTPYLVVENNYEVKRLQPRGPHRHAVFFTMGRESVSLHYERKPEDPRITHDLHLEVGPYGNVLNSSSIAYGRKIADPALPPEVTRDEQHLSITYREVDYTPDIDRGKPTSAYRLCVPYETRSFEITGIAPTTPLFQFDEIKGRIADAREIAYEATASGSTPEKRLLTKNRTLFLDNDLHPLPFQHWDTLGLIHASYQLAFTPGVTRTYYAGKVTDTDFEKAGYVHVNGDDNWWVPSDTAVYPPNPADHFYIPVGTKDPLGTETIATFDRYDLLVERVQVRQAAWNEVIATNDYRVLGPVMITDPNKNRSAVEIDALGMVVKSAVMGKEGAGEGDTLAAPTVRMEYELFNWKNHRKPNFVHVLTREQHGSANSRWQESYAYSNGSGGVAMVKSQAHPGKALMVNPDGTVTEVDANPRWVGTGRKVLNNKGNPVKQYEPYFSTTHEYEDETALREIGVSPVLYYDAVGRNVRTVFPNGTFSKVEFNPWMQKIFDANDTVKESQWFTERGSPDPSTLPEPTDDPERRAAWLAAKHAGTPGIVHVDSLGRSVYAISDYGGGKTAAVRTESDLTGRLSKQFDQAQREVASGFMGMAGTPIHSESAEKGRRWTFQNVLNALVKTWDEHGRELRAAYDNLHRLVGTFVQESGQAEILFNYVVYGDRHPNAAEHNLLRTAHQMFDQAGMMRVAAFDFKGNPERVERILAKEYKNSLDWNALAGQPDYDAIQTAANAALEIGEVFAASALHDALNRPTRTTLPDGTVIVPTYNEANFLASLQAQIRGQGAFVDFLKGQDYDAKGQRQFAHYGNELFTRYFYDPKTFRLINCQTGDLQNVRYTYDPVGNITQIRDDAQQTRFFNNAVVKPESLFEYDAVYQLIRATGREHAGFGNDAIRNDRDLEFVPQLPDASNSAAVRSYTEEYEYDLLGNITMLRHRFKTQAGAGSGWTRRYHYGYQDDPSNRTNRLNATSLAGDPDDGPYGATYDYDAYGNMRKMPHLAELAWNSMDQLRRVDLGGGGTVYYVYGADGQRIRKVIERQGNQRTERISLGNLEIYRERQNNSAPHLERQTLHISDDTGRIAQVDTKTRDDNNSDPANPLNVPLIRYQYGNHLGSAVLETNANGEVISYEEYHPYGTSAYRSAKPGYDLSLKRYRFSGKERDDETGLYYFGARYYAAWLGRWTSSDPAGFVDGFNLFTYCRNSPIVHHDPTGHESRQTIGLPGTPKDYLTAESTLEEREAFIGRKGYRMVDPHPEQQRWTGDHWELSPQGVLEKINPEGKSDNQSKPPPTTNQTSNARDAASVGTPASLVAAGTERFIWQHFDPKFRGKILERMYGVPWRSNTPKYDLIADQAVQQVRSTNNYRKIGKITRKAANDAADAIVANPTEMAGKKPQAVIITPTDTPRSAVTDVKTALEPKGQRKIPRNPEALPTEHIRGLPGRTGRFLRGTALVGTGLSALALYNDYKNRDVPMGVGDLLGTAGGGLELYAMATGATVAMSAGLILGGAGIAITSGVSAVRAYRAGDTLGAAAGAVGVAAGVAIMAGVVLGAPVVLAAGLIAATLVGVFHVLRWAFSKK